MYRNSLDAVFIQTTTDKRFALIRDKDMAGSLTRDDQIGFLGSDTYGELTKEQQRNLVYTPLAETALRFTLAAPNESADRIAERIAAGKKVSIATSYPRTVRQLAKQNGLKLSTKRTMGGSVEVAPIMFEDIDAVVDLTDSGETLRQNGMTILRDNLGAVTLGAVWLAPPPSQPDTGIWGGHC